MMTIGVLYYSPQRPVLLGEEFSWKVRSDRDRDILYTVTRFPDGRWDCDCPAFRYESRADGQCKHIDRKRAEWDAPAPDFPELGLVGLCWT
jgi:hypothetical protein